MARARTVAFVAVTYLVGVGAVRSFGRVTRIQPWVTDRGIYRGIRR